MGIMNREGALYMATGVDNSGLYSGLNQAEGRIDQFGNHISSVGDKITRLTGIGFGVAGLKAFGTEIINVTGEMQMLESSFEVLLGGKGVSGFMSEMKQFAVDSPLSMKGVANASQTLLGFGISAEKVMPTIKQIGDISMGNEDRFKSLSLAFAQMSATGKLMGQDLLQMINAGFNPLTIISEKTGKSIGELKKDMENGAISSEMVANAFESATAEGGRFYGMTQKQAEGVKGLQAQLEGGIQEAFNNIGKSQEDLIVGGYKLATTLVENYQTIGEIMVSLVATYGLYKAALITTTALEKIRTTQAVYDIATKEIQLGLTIKNIWAQSTLNKVLLANPYALVAASVIALGYGVYKLSTATSTQEKAQVALNKAIDEAKKKKEDLGSKTDNLVGIVNSETKTIYDRITAYKELQGLYPKLLANMDIHTFKTLSTAEQQKILNQAINEFDISNQDAELVKYETLLDNLTKAIGKGANAFGEYEKEAKKLLGLDGFWDARLNDEYDIKRILEATIVKLKEEKIQRQENLKEAEFQAKPEAEKREILQKQLDVLKDQESAITDNILATGEYKRNIDGTISPASELEKKFTDITDLLNNWNKTPFAIKNAFETANPVLNDLLTKMRLLNEEKQKLTGQLTSSAIPIVKNKDYWDNQKKEADKFKDNLDSSTIAILESGKNLAVLPSEIVEGWKTANKKLAEAKKELKVYEDPDKASKAADSAANKAETAAEKAAKGAREIADQEEKITDLEVKQKLESKRKQEDLENQLTQSRISNLANGAEKIRYQQELDNHLEIQSLERAKEDYIQAYIQAEREKFDAAEDLEVKKNSKHIKKRFDSKDITVDTSSYDTIVNNKRSNQSSVQLEAEKKAWNEYLIQFGSYQEKRKAIIEKYDNEIKQALTKGDAAILEKQKQNQLDELDNSVKNSATLMGQLFADMSKKSVNEMQAIIDKAEMLMQYLEAVKDEQGNATISGKVVSKQDVLNLGLSENTLNNLNLSTQEVESLRNAIGKLKGELGGRSPFKAFSSQIKDAIKDINGGKLGLGISEIGSAVTQFAPDVAQFGKDLGNIVGNDDLGNKIAGVADAIGGLGQTAVGVGQIMSGDIVGGAMSAVSGISKTVDALDGLFGADYSKYNAMKDQYDKLNEVWSQLIDKKKEYLSMAYGEEAKKVGKEAEELVNKSIESYRTLGKEHLNSGASAGSHSKGVRQRERINSEGWTQLQQWQKNNSISDSLYNSVAGGRMTGLFDLTADQLQKLKEDAPTFWAKLNEETKEYLNNIIDGSEKIEDINKSIKEQLTQVSFDSVFDEFVDTLMNMDSSSKDFADNFSQYLQKAILSSLAAEKYRDKLKNWYDNFAKANEDSNIDSKEYASLQSEYNKIVDDALKERDALKELLDWKGSDDSSSSQSSSRGGFETMTQDQAGELNGRFTALQMNGEDTLAIILLMQSDTSKLREYNLITAEGILEMKQTMMYCMDYLAAISKNTFELYEINKGIKEISKNTKGLISK